MTVGVDLGATRVRAYRVYSGPEGLWAGERREATFGSFRSPALEAQLAGAPLSEEEEEAGLERVEIVAATIAALTGGSACRLGIAAPGLKTDDRRGIRVLRYGPRLPRLVEQLEVRLGLEMGPLGDDGHLAGWGEERGRGGLFAGCRDAYLLGAGTGLAQALKRGGRILPPEEVPRLPLEAEDALRAERLRTHPQQALAWLDALVREKLPLERVVLSQRFAEHRGLLEELECDVLLSVLPEAPALGAVAVLSPL